jgi:hypothetical protein
MRLASLALIAASGSTTQTRRATIGGRARYSSILIARAAAIGWLIGATGCYVTTFDGPMAEQRAREYFGALKAGRLKMLWEIG